MTMYCTVPPLPGYVDDVLSAECDAERVVNEAVVVSGPTVQTTKMSINNGKTSL